MRNPINRTKKLAICIPTYRRDSIIDKVLDAEWKLLSTDVNIFVFDSSEDKLTEKIIRKYIMDCPNVSYCRLDSSVSSNMKVFMIYRHMASMDYDFVWIIHDHTLFDKIALDFVLENLTLDKDLILLKMESNNFRAVQYKSLYYFYLENSWLLGKFGSVIVNRQRFLTNIDWDRYIKKYIRHETENYSHIGLYLEHLSELDNPNVWHLDFFRDHFKDIMKYEKFGWYKATLHTCLECWGEVILSLPEVYKDKVKVLRTQNRWFLSKCSLIQLKKNGVYDVSDYINYRKWFKIIRPDMYYHAAIISVLPYKVSKWLYGFKMIMKIEMMKFRGYPICIYGAGRYAVEAMNYLELSDIYPQAILVTDKHNQPNEIRNCPVYQAEDYLHNNKAFIIISVHPSSVAEIESYLCELKNKHMNFEFMSYEM